MENGNFEEFFASGKDDTLSPFLTPSSKRWAKNLSLKVAITSAIFLTLSFAFQFIHPALSHLFLVFVYFLSGTPALIESIEDIKEFNINIDVLMTLAALFSVVIGSGLEGGLLLVLFALSHAMEDAVIHKTKGALNQLNQLSPTMATVLFDQGQTRQKSVREIVKGEKVVVKSGEVIPLDGEVIEGASLVNMVHLTGEAVPISKAQGDEVAAGSMNLDGFLTVRVTKPSSESTLAKIITLITQAHAAKPKLQKFLDRFGKPYAVTIILLSLFFSLILPLFGVAWLGMEGSIYRALAFLIAASPCALIIATPTAFLSSISACAKKGILLKGGVALDALSHCQKIALDKTGTLTTGNLTLMSIEPFGESAWSEQEALAIAASLESKVVHPISRAIVHQAKEEKLTLPKIHEMKSIAGKGIEGVIEKEGRKVFVNIGSFSYIESLIKDQRMIEEVDSTLKREGHVITLLLIDNSLFVLHFQDELRPEMKEVIDRLHRAGMGTVMLTGDHKPNAEYVGEEVGIQEIFADLKPEDKLNIISQLSKNEKLAMIGDGVNDAPALARAHVGISMGGVGSQTAIEASDIVFLNDNIDLLPWLAKKSRSTMSIIKQNLTFALVVILFATTPALLGFIPLWLAVVLHEGGTIIVALNSLRLLKTSL